VTILGLSESLALYDNYHASRSGVEVGLSKSLVLYINYHAGRSGVEVGIV